MAHPDHVTLSFLAAQSDPWYPVPMGSNSPNAGRGAPPPIEVVPYDSTWPAKFASEKALLEGLLGRWIVAPVEHIGSTAVPGLDAKPVIDIMVGVESLDASRDAIPVALRAQYEY